MKKFILMLALSLGGIVSAQSFSFNCGGFSTEEVADLYEAEFEVNGGVFQYISSPDADSYANITRLSANSFEVGDDISLDTRRFTSLADAIAFASIPSFTNHYATEAVIGFDLSETFSLLGDGLTLNNAGKLSIMIEALDTDGNPNGQFNEMRVSHFPNGRTRDLHDADGIVIGTETYYYATLGFNVPLRYSATATGIIEQILALNL